MTSNTFVSTFVYSLFNHVLAVTEANYSSVTLPIAKMSKIVAKPFKIFRLQQRPHLVSDSDEEELQK